jgi:hypothetical protein
MSLFDRIDALAAYYAGKGPRPPDPPCPPWIDPAEWASRLRIGRRFGRRVLGGPPETDCIRDMTDDERRAADGYAAALALVEGGGSGKP